MRITLLTLLLAGTLLTNAQYDSTSYVLTKQDSIDVLDSLQADLAFFLSSQQAISFAEIKAGFGSGYFTLKDIQTNNASKNQLYYQSSASYYHKSGFSISARTLFTNSNNRFTLFQYAINPSYNYSNANFNFGVSYNYYNSKDSLSFYTSPLSHDFFVSAKYKKWFIRPSLGIGYAFGSQQEVIVQRLRTITSTINAKDYYTLLSFDHSFRFPINKNKRLSKLLTVEPILTFFMATNNYGINTAVSNIPTYLNRRQQRALAAIASTSTQSSPFILQSVLSSIYLNYQVGSWFVESQLTLDYTAPKSTSKFTPFGLLALGLNF